MKKIMLLTTGGTITGEEQKSGGYIAGAIHPEKILEPIKHKLNKDIRVEIEEICSIDSKDMDEDIWKKLYVSIKHHTAEEDVVGIVVTHGTDTMIETAFFIECTIKANKPIVFTGAMRPATALSPDGRENLVGAISTAAMDNAVKNAALIVMNDEIHAAFDAIKAHKNNVAAFNSPNIGKIGVILNNKPIFFSSPKIPHKIYDFDIERPFPYVPILTAFAGDTGELIRIVAKKAKGIVYAGFGAGTMPEKVHEVLLRAAEKGVKIMIGEKVTEGATQFVDNAFLSAGFLSPEKARILLLLELMAVNTEKL